ncbi:MAG: DNA polymerase III subunit beta [Candidatus Eiseniibacteriota bacterium]|nr:MAG: DNA polymerase III subunit beta [Candidatus Eisenbacteria bacterium]
MRFTIMRPDLEILMNRVITVVPPKSTLPVLSTVLIEAKENLLRATSTDLDMSISASVACNVSEEGSVCIPARRFAEIAKKLPTDEVRIAVEDFRVKVECGRGKYELSGMEAVDFPRMPEFKSEFRFTLPSTVLRKGERRCLYAASVDESRPVLNGIFLQLFPTELRMVATDGHRLAKVSFSGSYVKEKVEVIVPPKALRQVVRLIPEGECNIEVGVSKNYIMFEVDDSIICSRVLEGPFPNYEQVIPKETSKKLVINTEELIDAITRVSIFADNVTHQVRFSLRSDKVNLSVSTADVGEGKESVPASYDGEEMDIGYNANYVLEILKSVDSDEVTFSLNTPLLAGLVEPMEKEKGEDLLCLIMPLRLTE